MRTGVRPVSGLEPAPGGWRDLIVLGMLASVRAATLVAIAEAIARGLVSVISGDPAWRDAVVLGILAGALRALVTWATHWYSARAAIGAKESIRRDLAARVLAGGGGDSGHASVGATAVVGTVGLDGLDEYYRTVLPAIVTAATVPLLVAARILVADWVSALVIVLTVPLVPVFMGLVGLHTRDRADAASASLERLSEHLVELARGLPVLIGLGRVADQTAALRAISAEHRLTTMTTLRTTFLSSLVLELIASISVAVVAVFVGVRLVQGDLPLEVGLLALILAPECFAPFRDLGSAFHASQDGLAALRRSRELTSVPVAADIRSPAGPLRVAGVTVHRAGRELPVLDRIDLEVAPGSIVAVTGASGSGKTTLLEVLAGLVTPDGGWVRGIDPARVAWVPQHPRTVGSTVLDELRSYADDEDSVRDAVHRMGLTQVADSDPAQLSLGELRRLAVGRGLVRVAAGATLLVLDEPTAHLDRGSARLVEDAIVAVRGTATVIVASHEAGIVRLADQRLQMTATGDGREVEDAAGPQSPTVPGPTPSGGPRAGGSLLALVDFLRGSGWRLAASVLLGVAASGFAVALTAVSGWLIVRASEQPPIMYLLVAIVGVRFFGIGRAGLRYAERLVTHDAVLGATADLRVRMWSGLAAGGVGSRAATTGANALDHLVTAADQVRDLVPRVILPPVVSTVTAIAAIVAAAVIHPPSVPLLLGMSALGLLLAPALALAADRSSARAGAEVTSRVLRMFVALAEAADDLRANGVGDRLLADLDSTQREGGRARRTGSSALGLGTAVVVVAGTTTSALMLVVAAAGVADQSLSAALAAVLVLMPLALIDPLAGATDAVRQWPALAAALARVRTVTSPRAEVDVVGSATHPSGSGAGSIDRIVLDDLCGRWIGAGRDAFGPLTVSADRGEWIVVEGPSGSGKSTLLATLMRFLPPSSGTVIAPEPERMAWCPQDAHLFDSTMRGNLLLARTRDDAPTDAELTTAVTTAGLGPLVASLPLGLDTRIGPGGSRLSGGERQRLAVARTLLTRASVVLLDEPTTHLDAEAAERLMRELRIALADRVVVLVTHHASERLPHDQRVTLARRPVGLLPSR